MLWGSSREVEQEKEEDGGLWWGMRRKKNLCEDRKRKKKWLPLKPIRDDGAKSIVDAVKINKSITVMYLFNNNIEISTLQQIESLLERNKAAIERRRILTALLSCLSE